MSSRRKDRRAADDVSIYGRRVIFEDPNDTDPDAPRRIYYFRSRKARRAQARLDGKLWRDLSEHERFTL